MTVRFQADADFNHIIVAAVLRQFPEVDFRTAHSAGLTGLSNTEVLALAAHEGRVLVTHDQSTMPKHFAEFIRQSPSAGVIIVPQRLAVRDAVEDLVLVWAATQAEEWVNRTRTCLSELFPTYSTVTVRRRLFRRYRYP